jgi:hypothetical protein
MSQIFGEFGQIAYVTRDIQGLMRFFIDTCRVGPWFYTEHRVIDKYFFRGKPYDIVFSVAIANNGKWQIELIQQRNDAPSLFLEWLQRHPEGNLVHHFAAWDDDYEAMVARAKATGFEQLMGGVSSFGPFSYLQNPKDPDFTIEMAGWTRDRHSVYDKVAAAARSWDGSDPIRKEFPQP